MTHQFTFPATPYRQFPLRLSPDLADALDRVSKRTRITKTTISRIALEKFIAELQESGADAVVNEVCEV